MILNFIFDKIDNGIPVANIIQSTNKDWDTTSPMFEWGTDPIRHLQYGSYITSKHQINFLDIFQVPEDEDDQVLNIYPIFIHTTAFRYPWPLVYLNRRVIDLVNRNKLKILLSCTFENFPSENFLFIQSIGVFSQMQKIHKTDNIIVACTDFLMEKKIKDLNLLNAYPDTLPTPKFANLDVYQSKTLFLIRHLLRNVNHNYVDCYFDNVDKEKIFLFLCGRAIEYRYALYKIFEMNNMLSQSIHSFRNPTSLASLYKDTPDGPLWIDKYQDLKKFILANPDIPEIQLEESIIANFHNSPLEVGCHMEKEWIEKTYFSVVTETHVGSMSSQVTEKIYKLFYYCHPFIVMGSQGIIKELHKLGYETFPELFDESYDDMPYGIDKFMFIADQVKQYTTKQGKEKLMRILPSLKEKMMRNRQRFLDVDHYDKWANLKNL